MMRPLIVPGIIAAFSVVIIYLALQLKLSPPMIVGHSMQPRSFPIFLMVINLVLVAILAWDCMRNPPKPIKLEGMTTWVSISMFAAFYVLTTYADFLIPFGVVRLGGFSSWGGGRYLIAALISVTVPLTLFLLFDEVLKIRFPRGLITNWYYG